MKLPRLFRLELGRLLHSRITWLVAALTVLSPLAGVMWYRPLSANTTLGLCLANPALAGGAAGGVLFALLTIYELDRVKRGRMEPLMDAAVSPLTMALVRLPALLCTALLTLGLTMLAWLPYTVWSAGAVFDGQTYVLSYLLFMGLSLPLSILIAASAYQFTRRFDLSVVIFLALAGLSLTVWRGEWQLCWLNPCVWAISDDFSNFRIFRSVAYVRLTWLVGLLGVWTLSYLAIRRYGKGLVGSMLYGLRRAYRPVLAVLLLLCCVWAYLHQPFIDQSNPDLTAQTFYMEDPLEGLTCSERYADVHPDTNNGTVSGTATYQLQNTTGQEQTAVFLINPGYQITSARANGQETLITVGDYQESNQARAEVSIPADPEIELVLEYGGFPQDWNVVASNQGDPEISSRYLCLENADLTPTLLNAYYRDEVLPATVDVTLPRNMTAIPFGKAKAEVFRDDGGNTRTWRIEDTGFTTILYAGDYVREDVEAAGTTLQFYYGRKHQPIMEAADAAGAIKSVVEYCTAHYGPLSFFSKDNTMKLIQSRVAGGGYASRGSSLLDELDFTKENLNQSGKGTIPGEVMIHELVHQWWGLGNMFWSEDPADPWTSEGLTVYTTYRIVKDLYGADYAQEHYVDQWRATVENYYLNYYVRHPEYLEKLPEEQQLSISNSLAHVQQYNEVPLKILKAEELVGGEAAMDRILHDLFNREINYANPYLTCQEFLDACGLTEEDLRLD